MISFPTALSPPVSRGLSSYKVQQYLWMRVDSQLWTKGSLLLASLPLLRKLVSQWVSSGLQPCHWCQRPGQLADRRPAAGRCTPCPPSRASWFLPALAALYSTTCVTSCGFSRASRRGTVLLPRARVGHSHLDLNVGVFVAFGIQFWNELLEGIRISRWHIYT